MRRTRSIDPLAAVLLAAGALLRVAQYLANRSLFLDEAGLAMSALRRSYAGMLQPLELGQVAPAGFMMLEKLAVVLFGESEYALRLVPLLAGLASLLLFRRVALRCLEGAAVPIAVGLFALCGRLIDYSSELKQYSTDVAICLLLLDTALQAREAASGRRPILLLGAFGAAAIWISHPAVFVLAAAGVTLAVSAALSGDWKRLRLLVAAVLLWVGSFVACWAATLAVTARNTAMAALWAEGFPHSISDLMWLPRVLGAMFEYAAGPSFRGLGVLAFFVGCLALAVSDREKLALLAAPFLLTLIAAAGHRYPFADRLILFLFPPLFLLIGIGADRIRAGLHAAAPMAGAVWLALLFFHPVRDAARDLVRPRTREELRPVFTEVLAKRRPEDRIYVYHGANCAFLYYSRRFGFPPEDAVIGIHTTNDWTLYREDLGRLRRGRTWVLFSHVFTSDGMNEERLFLHFLDDMGRRLDAVAKPGASAYLYDLGGERVKESAR